MIKYFVMMAYLILHIEAYGSEFQTLDFSGFKIKGVYGKNKNNLNTLMQVYKNDLGKNDKLKTSGLFSYVPTGVHKNFLSKNCDTSALTFLIEQSVESNSVLDRNIENWADSCGSEIYSAFKLPAIIKAQMLNYNLSNNPFIFNVEFTLKNGDKLTGVLALKDLTTKRPLIISKCGLYCDASASTDVNDTVMHLFDESEYNLLALSSSTGEDFAKNNNYINFGGFIEGDHFIQVSRMLLSDESFMQYTIGEIHLHGISLGGNAALMGAVYASNNKDLPIKSAVATCPVVDLKPTMESIFGTDARGQFYRILTLKHMKAVYDDLPDLQKYLDPDKKYLWTQKEIFNAFVSTAVDNAAYATRDNTWTTAPFENTDISDSEDFWEANNFTNHIDEINIPTTVLYSSDDMFVLDEFNANPLARKLLWNQNDNIGIIDLKRGNHCAFSVGIGWGVYSTLIKSHFRKYSDFSSSQNEVSPLTLNRFMASTSSLTKIQSKMRKKDQIVKSEWQVQPDQEEVKLKLTVFSPTKSKRRSSGKGRKTCRYKDPLKAPSWCYKTLHTKVAVSSLAGTNISIANNHFNAQKVTRWLNINTTLLDDKYTPIKGTSNMPVFINFSGAYQ